MDTLNDPICQRTPKGYVPRVTLFSQRLPHVLTRSDLAYMLAPTYAREVGVSEELAHERMVRALKSQALCDKIYDAVSDALVAVQGSKTEDKLMDELSKAVPKRIGKIEAAPTTPPLSAVMVWLNIEIGLAQEDLRATLQSERGRTLLKQGFRGVAESLVKQLIR